jgi:hypothetical protein
LSVNIKKLSAAAKRQALPKSGKQEGKPEVTGLCVTCVHRADCSYMKNSTQAVVFCEEFDSQMPAAAVAEAEPEVAVVTEEQMKVWDEYKGLCYNCENRTDCAIRNAEVGVWHCEEYR